jgi:hypothetical protein
MYFRMLHELSRPYVYSHTNEDFRLMAERDSYLAMLALEPDREADVCLERQTDLSPTWLGYTPLSFTSYNDPFTHEVLTVHVPCGDERNSDFLSLCHHENGRDTGHNWIDVSYAKWPPSASIRVCEKRVAWWNEEGRFYEARKWRKQYTYFLRGVMGNSSALPALLWWCRRHGAALTWPPYVLRGK